MVVCRDDGPLDGLHLGFETIKPSYQIHSGFRMPLGFPPEGFTSALEYQPKPGDLFVCTYPKCGTTWVQYIVYLLVRQRRLTEGDALGELFPHLEEVGSSGVERLVEPRLIKTHLPLAMTPFNAVAKYIVVARNPFDCAVSFYHHTRGFPKHYDFADGAFEDFFDCFLNGEVDFGDYFEHLLPWYEAAAEYDNVSFLTYESLKADPAAGIGELARFIGGTAELAAADPANFASILEETSFPSMRRDQQRWSSQRPSGLPFVRKGSVGDWQSLFSREQCLALLKKFESYTGGSNVRQLWPSILEAAREHGQRDYDKG